VASRSLDLIELTANEIIKKGGQAIAMPVDVSNPQSIERLVALTRDY
jgi:NADP-dependent 3-hydroxy acid dehydrogenase YdfG